MHDNLTDKILISSITKQYQPTCTVSNIKNDIFLETLNFLGSFYVLLFFTV